MQSIRELPRAFHTMKRAKTLFADREVEFVDRDLAMKQVEGLVGLERLGGRVCGVVLFGSVARGLAGAGAGGL